MQNMLPYFNWLVCGSINLKAGSRSFLGPAKSEWAVLLPWKLYALQVVEFETTCIYMQWILSPLLTHSGKLASGFELQ